MENEQLLSGITALLEVKNENSKQLDAIKSDLKSIKKKLDDFESKLNVDKSIQADANEATLAEMAAELKRIQVQLGTLPQNTRQEKRILLFPEHNAKDYYSVMLKWFLYIIVASYSCYLLRCLIDKMN